jgi:hypothetical protein
MLEKRTGLWRLAMADRDTADLAFGFWWIKANPGSPAEKAIGAGWQVAELTNNGWYVCGNEWCFRDSERNREQLEIGAKVTLPGT